MLFVAEFLSTRLIEAVAVPGPLSLSSIVLDKRGPGTATLHCIFQDGGARKFKSEKSPSENLGLWTYKTKDSFFCYASDINCVQRAFWAQLVETVEVPFKRFLS